MAKKGKTRAQSQSGAVGGPGTGSGLNYQVDFAVLNALRKIAEALINPLKNPDIAMEPRLVAGPAVTCWDVRTSLPDVCTEAKVRPKADDIIEWLDRVEVGLKQSPETVFELFYGAGASQMLAAIERLCRIANEAGGDASKFNELLDVERTPDFDKVLDRIKSAPYSSFMRIRLSPFDRGSLRREIDVHISHLVRDGDRQALYELLFSKFSRGNEGRLKYAVRDLIAEANSRRIEFNAPRTFELQDIDSVVADAVYILQECGRGLPDAVIAAGVECSTDQLNESLSRYAGCALLSRDGNLWSIAPFKPTLVRDNGTAIFAKTLIHLLEFIRRNEASRIGWEQIPNAIAIAKACQTKFPEQVSELFWQLNSLLKRTGNKRLVLEVANLSLACANRKPRTERQAKAEAVALICGRSWVFQRTNRLAEARADAEKSLKLGNEIGWDRNTAFCEKCIGRLYRIEAEQAATDKTQSEELLGLSINHIKRAIELFQNVSELTAQQRTAEIGDCFSLMGRTLFVARDYNGAFVAAKEAAERLTEESSKDYADLQILLGDLARYRNDQPAATAYYDEAIRLTSGDDAEKSEIAARAWFQKGRLVSNGGYFEKAAEIWTALDEPDFADRAKWESMVLGKKIPRGASEPLIHVPPSVRLEVLRLHDGKLAELGTSFRGRRSDPDARYWQNLITDAKKNVAVGHVEW